MLDKPDTIDVPSSGEYAGGQTISRHEDQGRALHDRHGGLAGGGRGGGGNGIQRQGKGTTTTLTVVEEWPTLRYHA